MANNCIDKKSIYGKTKNTQMKKSKTLWILIRVWTVQLLVAAAVTPFLITVNESLVLFKLI